MNEQQNVAYIQSQVACALIEAMGMQAENQMREYLQQAPAYSEDSFQALFSRYEIDHNSVMSRVVG